MEEVYIIIPALNPEPRLLRYVEKLESSISACIIVVDDGSEKRASHIFAQLSEKNGCTVLHHCVNRGKGRALKTGFCYVKNHCGDLCRIITVDCDGQHRVEDVMRVLEKLRKNPGTFVLGERDFSVEGVPFRSRFGNTAISLMFWLTSGKWLKDTQTGLRAFDRSLLNKMIETPGERFDYEMQTLAECAKERIRLCTVDIATIYENGNRGSNFRVVKDSISVLKTLLSNLAVFGLSSLFCAGLDIFLFWVFTKVMPENDFFPGFQKIAGATAAARLISAGVNFLINRSVVFRSSGKLVSLTRYIALCTAVAAVSAFFVTVVSGGLHLSPTLAKIIIDTALFFLSYLLQKFWVFRKEKNKNEFKNEL